MSALLHFIAALHRARPRAHVNLYEAEYCTVYSLPLEPVVALARAFGLSAWLYNSPFELPYVCVLDTSAVRRRLAAQNKTASAPEADRQKPNDERYKRPPFESKGTQSNGQDHFTQS